MVFIIGIMYIYIYIGIGKTIWERDQGAHLVEKLNGKGMCPHETQYLYLDT
jgi:hypothetical protein